LTVKKGFVDVIFARGLIKSFRGKLVLKGLTFSVKKGSITGFVGPNGAGKTTTIKILSGLLRKDKGEVYILGEDPWDNPRLRKKVSVIFTKLPYPSNDTVREYLEDLNSVFHGDLARLIKEFNLQDHMRKRVSQLSSGQAQKIQLIASLLKNPELVIADEPTANLDPQARIEFYDMVKALARDYGVTFFISSHILSELERVIDHVVFIDDGMVKALGELSYVESMVKGEEILILVRDKERALQVLKDFNPVVDGPYIKVRNEMRKVIDILDDNHVEVLSVRKVSLDDVFRKLSGV
jgi:ABC-2 type transport system ATP-binding protein